jgi:hypothetical protein
VNIARPIPTRLVVGVAGLLALAASVGLSACGGDDGPRTVETGGASRTLAGGPEGIYVGTYGGQVQLLDAGSGDVLVTRTLDDVPTALAVAGDSLYAAVDRPSSEPDLVIRLDAATLDEQARAEIESGGGMVVAVNSIGAGDAVVVVGDFDNVVLLDPATLEQRGRTDDLPRTVIAAAAGGEAAYAVTADALYQLDPASAEIVAERAVPYGPVDECGLSADADGVWMAGTQSAGRYAAGSLDPVAEVEGIENSQAVVATGDGGALLRASTSDGDAVLTVGADGTVDGRTEMPGGNCLARGGDGDSVWGRYVGKLVTTEL